MVEDVSAVILAIPALLTPLGAGLGWVIVRNERRFARVEAALDRCEQRDIRQRRVLTLYEAAIALVLDELEILQPNASALARAKKLLSRAAHPEIDDDTYEPFANRGRRDGRRANDPDSEVSDS